MAGPERPTALRDYVVIHNDELEISIQTSPARSCSEWWTIFGGKHSATSDSFISSYSALVDFSKSTPHNTTVGRAFGPCR